MNQGNRFGPVRISVTGWFSALVFAGAAANANAKPTAAPDDATTDHENAVTVDVLSNDTDPNGNQLLLHSVAQPEGP